MEVHVVNESLTNDVRGSSGEIGEDQLEKHVLSGVFEDTGNGLDPTWDAAYLCMSILWLILGVPGNLLVLLSILSFKELKTIPMAQTANLAMSDLLVSSMNVVSTWALLLFDSDLMTKYNIICLVTGYICGVGCRCSIASICCIAINRYVAICQDQVYSRIYNALTMPFHLLLPWLVGPLVMLPAVVEGQVAFRYDRRQLICPPWYFTEDGYQPVQWWETLWLLPPSLLIMAFSSYKIFARVHESGRNFSRNKTYTERDIQLLKVLIIMFFVFIGANFPWFLLVSLDFNDQAHHGFYYVTVWLVHTATTLNPVIYAAKYPQFQKCFKKFVNRLFCNQLFETRVNSVAALHKNMSQFHHNNNQNNNNNIGNNNHDNINNIGNNKHDINNIGNNNDDNDIANRDRSNININNSNDKINNITSHDDNEAKQNNLSSARKTRGRKLSRQSQHESYEQ